MCNCQLCWQWWAQVESNHRPHAYQACALTFWAMSPCYLHISGIHLWSSVLFLLNFTSRFCNRWWRWRDSNPWPPACRAGALPTELHPHIEGRSNSEKWRSVFHLSPFIIHSVLTTVPENRTTNWSYDFVLIVFFVFFVSSRRLPSSHVLHRKEVIQPHLPIRLPCYYIIFHFHAQF